MNLMDFENIALQIITNAGSVKTNAFLAIKAAKNQDWTTANKKLEDAIQALQQTQIIHTEVIQNEAQQNTITAYPLVYIHAEDQMMTAQMVLELAKEFIELYKRLNK